MMGAYHEEYDRDFGPIYRALDRADKARARRDVAVALRDYPSALRGGFWAAGWERMQRKAEGLFAIRQAAAFLGALFESGKVDASEAEGYILTFL